MHIQLLVAISEMLRGSGVRSKLEPALKKGLDEGSGVWVGVRLNGASSPWMECCIVIRKDPSTTGPRAFTTFDEAIQDTARRRYQGSLRGVTYWICKAKFDCDAWTDPEMELNLENLLEVYQWTPDSGPVKMWTLSGGETGLKVVDSSIKEVT